MAVLEVERRQLNHHRNLLLERQKQLRERKRAARAELDVELYHLDDDRSTPAMRGR